MEGSKNKMFNSSHNLDIESEVKKIAAEVAEIDAGSIRAEASLFEDLGLDSMEVLEILVMVERRFNLQFREEDLVQLKTVKSTVDLIAAYLAKEQNE